MTGPEKAREIVQEWLGPKCPIITPVWGELVDRIAAALDEAHRGARSPSVERSDAGAFWMIERQIDGRAHWLSWRGRSRRAWVTDATQADHFDWSLAAAREARLLTEIEGVECVATEHSWSVERSDAGAPPETVVPYPCQDDCKLEWELPKVLHPIFGETTASYHDLAHLYVTLLKEVEMVRGEARDAGVMMRRALAQRDAALEAVAPAPPVAGGDPEPASERSEAPTGSRPTVSDDSGGEPNAGAADIARCGHPRSAITPAACEHEDEDCAWCRCERYEDMLARISRAYDPKTPEGTLIGMRGGKSLATLVEEALAQWRAPAPRLGEAPGSADRVEPEGGADGR